MIDSYQTVLWDFDGVILDSMPIREVGFREVLTDFPLDQVEALVVYHRANGGLSRYRKFRYLYEDIRGEQVTDERIQQLAGQFKTIMLKHLINPELLIGETVDYIETHHGQQAMHVVSGSDQAELRQICTSLHIDRYFGSINGSPTPKKTLVGMLLEKHAYDHATVCLVGDSFNDWEAAQTNGIDFFGYNNVELEQVGKGYINAF